MGSRDGEAVLGSADLCESDVLDIILGAGSSGSSVFWIAGMEVGEEATVAIGLCEEVSEVDT